MIAIALTAFTKYKVTNRVKLLEGPAADTLKTLRGEFDIIFIDADKPGYKTYVEIILERRLLSKNGIIIADNGTPPPPNYHIVHHFTSISLILIGKLMIVLSRGLVVDRTDANPYTYQAWRHK